MKPSLKILALSSCVYGALLNVSSKASAWGDLGHQVVGLIAEETMAPATKDLVRGILGIEPLGIAAVFPDHVKSDKRFGSKPVPGQTESNIYDFSPYHFSAMPVGEGLDPAKRKIEKDSYGIIKYSKDVLKNPQVARETKALVLRYLIHVVGDIHQPLHVGNGFDRGGNACQVKWQASSKDPVITTNLHSWWDTNIIDFIAASFADPAQKIYPPRYYHELFAALKKKHPDLVTEAAKQKYGRGALLDWYTEAQALREKIYPDDKATMAQGKYGEEYKNRAYCLWYIDQDRDQNPAPGSKIDPAKIPVLNAEYATRFQPMAEEQLFKAGLRLAVLLDEVANEVKGDARFPRVTDAQEKSILQSFHEFLKNVF